MASKNVTDTSVYDRGAPPVIASFFLFAAYVLVTKPAFIWIAYELEPTVLSLALAAIIIGFVLIRGNFLC